ncbi:DUF2634 domain-containing protein [Bacillus sp. FJAT-45350]|uniref:DUF2634 domain-containing protein n=1 Tax=Bacillus sp. FJAT-45350 TaxID=2011014 RepID=UPI000BB729C8|nr:DUF2634 domain-containing protein [Bacillus sp. FJAT-45350]
MLYPAFELPDELNEALESQEAIYDISLQVPRRDFETGEFVTDPTGRIVTVSDLQAYAQWAYACVRTEKGKYLAYDENFGVEIEDLMRSELDNDIKKSEIERRVTEALMIDSRTTSVGSFEFEVMGDQVLVKFIVETIYGNVPLNLRYGGGLIAS